LTAIARPALSAGGVRQFDEPPVARAREDAGPPPFIF
jgi:hypothetical protein